MIINTEGWALLNVWGRSWCLTSLQESLENQVPDGRDEALTSAPGCTNRPYQKSYQKLITQSKREAGHKERERRWVQVCAGGRWLQSCIVSVLHSPKGKCNTDGCSGQKLICFCAPQGVIPAVVLPEVLFSSAHAGELKKNRVMYGACAWKRREQSWV